MPPPKILANVQPGNFIGDFVAPLHSGESKVALLGVFEGAIADPAQAALVGADVRLYEFMPAEGNELDTTSEPYARAAVHDAIREDDGHIGAEMSLAVGGEATSSHLDTPNPVIEGSTQFKGLFKALTSTESVDRLHIRPENTDLNTQELQMLGFSATGTNSDVLTLDLADNHRPAAAA